MADVEFRLPRSVEPEVRDEDLPDGTPVSLRFYQVEQEDLAVSATFTVARKGWSVDDARSRYEQVVAGLRAAGARDARLSSVVERRHGKLPALDAAISFTAKTGQQSRWRLRTVVTPRRMITLQVVTFLESGDRVKARRADAAFATLVAGLVP